MDENTRNISIGQDAHVDIHELPRLLYPTFKEIFPEMRKATPPFYILVVWQKTVNDMSGYSDLVEEERSQKTQKVS